MPAKGKGKRKVTTGPMDPRKTREPVTGHPDGDINAALDSIILSPPHTDDGDDSDSSAVTTITAAPPQTPTPSLSCDFKNAILAIYCQNWYRTPVPQTAKFDMIWHLAKVATALGIDPEGPLGNGVHCITDKRDAMWSKAQRQAPQRRHPPRHHRPHRSPPPKPQPRHHRLPLRKVQHRQKTLPCAAMQRQRPPPHHHPIHQDHPR